MLPNTWQWLQPHDQMSQTNLPSLSFSQILLVPYGMPSSSTLPAKPPSTSRTKPGLPQELRDAAGSDPEDARQGATGAQLTAGNTGS